MITFNIQKRKYVASKGFFFIQVRWFYKSMLPVTGRFPFFSSPNYDISSSSKLERCAEYFMSRETEIAGI